MSYIYLRHIFGIWPDVCRRTVGIPDDWKEKWRWLGGKINLSTFCKEVWGRNL